MGFKIREISSNQRRRKTKERKVVDKYNISQQNQMQSRQSELIEDNISQKESTMKPMQLQNQSRRKKRNENVQKSTDTQTPFLVNSHTLIGVISYGQKEDSEKSNMKSASQPSKSDSCKPIEQQVLEYYQEKIDKLDVRQTLKSYLRRTLDTIILSNDSDKIFLLEIRKQLKQSQRIAAKEEYSEFLKLVDNLYLLAVDKHLTQIYGGDCSTPINTSQNSFRSFVQNATLQNAEIENPSEDQRSNSPTITDSLLRLQTTNTTEIVRILQRNALQRLAQAYRRMATNNYNSIVRLSNNSSSTSNHTFQFRLNHQTSQQQQQHERSSLNENNDTNRLNADDISTNNDDNNNHLQSSIFTPLQRSSQEEQDDLLQSSQRTTSRNPITHNSDDFHDQDDDLMYMMRSPSESFSNSYQRGIQNSRNTNFISYGRGRFIGVRSISNQVTANQGDTSIQTSSETGSNISN